MGLFSSIGGAVRDLGGSVRNSPKTLRRAGKGVINTPFETANLIVSNAFGTAGTALRGAGSLAGQATTILQENPALAGLAGDAFGVPGLGGLFGGGTAGSAATTAAPATAPSVPLWVWIAGGLAALLGLFLILRRKS